jgi:hypothetical protein
MSEENPDRLLLLAPSFSSRPFSSSSSPSASFRLTPEWPDDHFTVRSYRRYRAQAGPQRPADDARSNRAAAATGPCCRRAVAACHHAAGVAAAFGGERAVRNATIAALGHIRPTAPPGSGSGLLFDDDSRATERRGAPQSLRHSPTFRTRCGRRPYVPPIDDRVTPYRAIDRIELQEARAADGADHAGRIFSRYRPRTDR